MPWIFLFHLQKIEELHANVIFRVEVNPLNYDLTILILISIVVFLTGIPYCVESLLVFMPYAKLAITISYTVLLLPYFIEKGPVMYGVQIMLASF